jgi:kinesin family protein 5
MRAKSIKNKARVNAEMSPAELKALLKKTVAELAAVREHAASLEEEVKVWRAGGTVHKESWTPSLGDSLKSGGNMIATARKATSPIPSTPGYPSTPSRMSTPSGLLPSAFSESRPDTPSTFSISMDKDEREEFLKRENELSDQLAEKVSFRDHRYVPS